MSNAVTHTIACIDKNLIHHHKLSIGIVICPILSGTVAWEVKNLPIHTMVLSGVKKNLFVFKNCLKGQ
jgi:hypothetical protein